MSETRFTPDLCRALVPYATPATKKHVLAVAENGSISKAARVLGIARKTIWQALMRADARAVQAGQHPLAVNVANPPSMSLSKTTVHVHSERGIIEEWRRLVPGVQEVENWVESLVSKSKGCLPKIPAPKDSKNPELLHLWAIGDHHLGMRAWGRETGSDDHDTSKGLDMLASATAQCLPSKGSVGRIVIASLGDMWHADFRTPMTEKSGNVLDADTRWAKTLEVGASAIRMIVDEAARRAPIVDVVLVPGNHDYHTTVAVTRVLSAAYEKTPSIRVHDVVGGHISIEFGSVLLAFSHGDRIPPRRLQAVVASRFHESWGRTKHRYAHCGHIHKTKTGGYIDTRDEVEGMIVEHHPILPPVDAYAAWEGYASQRATHTVVYDSRYGEVGRKRVTPEMLEAKNV